MALQGTQGPTFQGSGGAVDRGFATPGAAPGAAPSAGTTTAPKPAAAAPAAATPGPAPLPTLSTDPSYLSFVRGLGLSDADAQAAAQMASARVGARLSNATAQSQFTGEEADRRLSGAMESRGLANSGEAQRALTYQRAQQHFREAAMGQTAAEQWENLTTQLALQRQAGQVQLANLGLSLAPNIDVNAGLAAQPLP